MRILQLTPGTGTFLCGSCLRDNALAQALQSLGHEVILAPLYLPFALEERAAGGEGLPGPSALAASAPVHMGGINMYLQQKLPLLGRLPRFLHDRLDAPKLLRFVARHASMTDTHGLGPMVLSMVRGEEGRQRAELERLVEWARELPQLDAVLLSNVMLAGLARELSSALGCPVYTTLQGEAPFLDALDARHRELCWRALSERARELDGCFAVSRYTADLMSARLGLAPDRVHVIWNGLDAADFGPLPELRDPARPAIGFLARMCRDKGLEALFEAFVRVKQAVPNARLVAAGVVLAEDRPLLDELARRARALGIEGDVELLGPVSREEKLRLLRRVDVFSVPATYGESFGLYLLEAWACGLPVVQPRHGAFPELLEATGAGVLVQPDEPEALATALIGLLQDPVRRERMGALGVAAVRERFTAARMARELLERLVPRERTQEPGAASGRSPGP
ncbi:MAG: glycosyltransferase family 4 protein [Planctomycetota bacterium]